MTSIWGHGQVFILFVPKNSLLCYFSQTSVTFSFKRRPKQLGHGLKKSSMTVIHFYMLRNRSHEQEDGALVTRVTSALESLVSRRLFTVFDILRIHNGTKLEAFSLLKRELKVKKPRNMRKTAIPRSFCWNSQAPYRRVCWPTEFR